MMDNPLSSYQVGFFFFINNSSIYFYGNVYKINQKKTS